MYIAFAYFPVYSGNGAMADRISLFLSFTVLLTALTAIAVLCCGLPYSSPGNASGFTEFREDFSVGFLDPNRWVITQAGDTKLRVIDVMDVDSSEKTDYRLRIGADTIGTRDDTVKYQGVRTVQDIELEGNKTVSVDLDWNHQSNGCYLSASLYLCPTITDANPEDENDWLKIEYAGVPPGQNARIVIASKTDGTVNYLYQEGWPEQKTGRTIANQQIWIRITDGRIRVMENGTEIYRSEGMVLDFTSACLYLQMSGHSNYPLREIYFDNVIIA